MSSPFSLPSDDPRYVAERDARVAEFLADSRRHPDGPPLDPMTDGPAPDPLPPEEAARLEEAILADAAAGRYLSDDELEEAILATDTGGPVPDPENVALREERKRRDDATRAAQRAQLDEAHAATVRERNAKASVYTVRALADLPSADEQYIVGDGILTRGGKVLVYAKSGAGKTTLVDFMAGPLATGRPFLGRFAIDRPRRVLVVQGELSLPEMASHAQALVSAGFDTEGLMFARMTDLRLPAGEDRLRQIITDNRIEIVALDPWYRLFSGESSNAPEQVGMVFDVCDRLLEDGLIEGMIVVHHANVGGFRTAGSWLFEGWPSTMLKLEQIEGSTDRKLIFEKIRAPGSSLAGTVLRIALGEQGYLPITPGHEPVGSGAIVARSIVVAAGGSLNRAELLPRLMERAHVKLRAANKYLGQAIQGDLLRRVQDGNSTVYQVVE